jgi:hypothetical protein
VSIPVEARKRAVGRRRRVGVGEEIREDGRGGEGRGGGEGERELERKERGRT